VMRASAAKAADDEEEVNSVILARSAVRGANPSTQVGEKEEGAETDFFRVVGVEDARKSCGYKEEMEEKPNSNARRSIEGEEAGGSRTLFGVEEVVNVIAEAANLQLPPSATHTNQTPLMGPSLIATSSSPPPSHLRGNRSVSPAVASPSAFDAMRSATTRSVSVTAREIRRAIEEGKELLDLRSRVETLSSSERMLKSEVANLTCLVEELQEETAEACGMAIAHKEQMFRRGRELDAYAVRLEAAEALLGAEVEAVEDLAQSSA